MKPISNSEFLTLVQSLRQQVGSRFQDASEDNGKFYWTFWRPQDGESHWLIDLQSRDPLLMPLPATTKPKKANKKSPAGLFLNAHFVNKHVLEVNWSKDLGRVIHLKLTDDHDIELRLFRGGANMILRTPSKNLSFNKPLELKPLEWRDDGPSDRSLEELMNHYWSLAGGGSAFKPKGPEDLKAEKIKKLQVAIEKAKLDLQAKEDSGWLKAAQWLEQNQSLDVPRELISFVNQRLSLHENIQLAYSKGKIDREKKDRVLERIAQLESELKVLEETPAENFTGTTVKGTRPANRKTSSSKLRSLTLPSGHQLLIGRSGKENLEILRVAAAWDYWIHLRDYPSAHAVLRRNKNESLSEDVIRYAVNTFIRENFRAKLETKIGTSFDVMVAELRHVKPIKGDKLGRVTFSHERILRHLLK